MCKIHVSDQLKMMTVIIFVPCIFPNLSKSERIVKKGHAKVFRREKSSADVRVEDVTTSVVRVVHKEKSNSEVFKFSNNKSIETVTTRKSIFVIEIQSVT